MRLFHGARAKSGVVLCRFFLGDWNFEESTDVDRLWYNSPVSLPFPSSSFIFLSFASSCSFNFFWTWIWISFADRKSLSGSSPGFSGDLFFDQDRRDLPDFLYPSEDQPEPLLDRFLLVDGGGFVVSPSLNVVTSFLLFDRLREFLVLLLSLESLRELLLRWRDFDRDLDRRERLREELREYERRRRWDRDRLRRIKVTKFCDNLNL